MIVSYLVHLKLFIYFLFEINVLSVVQDTPKNIVRHLICIDGEHSDEWGLIIYVHCIHLFILLNDFI